MQKQKNLKNKVAQNDTMEFDGKTIKKKDLKKVLKRELLV
jgi:hypothetical protein